MMFPGQGLAQPKPVPEVELPLSEAFGPTFQGEGPATGRRCWFVRLGLCNLSCEWCDTPYTWDTSRYDVAAECPDTPTSAILDRLGNLGAEEGSLVVLSGGEPMMHRAKLPHLLHPRYEWHVETNGTLAPPSWWASEVAHTTVSPKVITQDRESKRIKPGVLSQWATMAYEGKATFKFVLKEPRDVDRLIDLTDTLGLRAQDVWVMPEGTSPEEILRGTRLLAQPALDAGFNLTTRLHTLIWADERMR